jgi:hypothetical protein
MNAHCEDKKEKGAVKIHIVITSKVKHQTGS